MLLFFIFILHIHILTLRLFSQPEIFLFTFFCLCQPRRAGAKKPKKGGLKTFFIYYNMRMLCVYHFSHRSLVKVILIYDIISIEFLSTTKYIHCEWNERHEWMKIFLWFWIIVWFIGFITRWLSVCVKRDVNSSERWKQRKVNTIEGGWAGRK